MALIGEFAQKARYQGAGSSVANPTKQDNAMDVIGNFNLNVAGFEAGYPRSGKLAESYPVRYEDVSSAPYFPAKELKGFPKVPQGGRVQEGHHPAGRQGLPLLQHGHKPI